MIVKKMVASIIIGMFLSCFSQAVMVMNNVTDPLPPGKDKTAVEQNVVFGAEHFLKGNAYALLSLSTYEQTIFNKEAFKTYLDKAIMELNLAKKYYSDALNTVANISLLLEKQDISKNYDYESLANKFSNKSLYNEVIELFRNYNILGIHKKNLENIENILYTMDYIVTQDKPDAQTMWTLFSNLTNAAQFGNYATQIAISIYK